MRTLKKNVKDKIDWNDPDEIQFLFLMYVFIFFGLSAFYFFILMFIINSSDNEINILLSFFLGITTILLHFFILKYINRNGPLFSKVDKSMFNIAYNFTNIKNFDNEKSLKILSELFASYSPVQTKKLFKKNINEKPDIDKNCKIILKESSEVKFFILYTLLDIAAFDGLYSLKEEEFIENVRKKIGIHSLTFKQIKKSYVKKGLREERKIIEEQNRRKLINQFSKFMLPYEAYRILGISPSATKQQIKKAYRTLAKKHHPDKFAGQSEEIIQKAEEKFQEIKEAYDVVLRKKKY